MNRLNQALCSEDYTPTAEPRDPWAHTTLLLWGQRHRAARTGVQTVWHHQSGVGIHTAQHRQVCILQPECSIQAVPKASFPYALQLRHRTKGGRQRGKKRGLQKKAIKRQKPRLLVDGDR